MVGAPSERAGAPQAAESVDTNMLTADLALTGALVYDSAFRRFRPATVVISGGRVLYVGSKEDALSQIKVAETRDLSGSCDLLSGTKYHP